MNYAGEAVVANTTTQLGLVLVMKTMKSGNQDNWYSIRSSKHTP
jgi:hypothetical protein